MDELSGRRFLELAERAWSQGTYQFTAFLDLAGQSDFHLVQSKLPPVGWQLYGGADGCERKVLRLGCEDVCGYGAPFPIVCLKIAPLSAKFAEPLTHRDYLGALMALGIERELLGDIAVRPEAAYLFCLARIAPYIADNFTQARRTSLSCVPCDAPPAGELFRVERRVIQLQSERLDAFIAHLFRLSRGDAQAFFPQGRVFVDGRLCDSPSFSPRPGQIISVRGLGRARYLGVDSLSKKGKCNTVVEVYV